MSINKKQRGDIGEKEVIDSIMCPNCGKKLMVLPPNYPLFDIQCTACAFRAQVKTNNKKPAKEIFGAGWEIVDKVLKSGYLMPPLITNYKWKENKMEKQEIRFYPFVPKINLKKSLRDIKSHNRKYWMFNYTDLDKLPYLLLYKSN